MRGNGFEEFIPKIYSSIDNTSFPLVAKLRPVTGTNSNGVRIVHSRVELEELLAKEQRKGEPYLLQEAILSNIEITFNYVAYRGLKFCCIIEYNFIKALRKIAELMFVPRFVDR